MVIIMMTMMMMMMMMIEFIGTLKQYPPLTEELQQQEEEVECTETEELSREQSYPSSLLADCERIHVGRPVVWVHRAFSWARNR